MNPGLALSLVALFSWGFGDFLIQKSARKLGDWESLLDISLIGTILLFPFAIHDLPEIGIHPEIFLILLAASAIFLFTSLVDFEALKIGKLSVIEPIGSLEVPVTGILAFLILQESITPAKIFWILILVAGLVLVSLRSRHFSKSSWLEKGIFLGLISAGLLGLTNFLIGFGSRIASPITTIWFLNAFMLIASLVRIFAVKGFPKFFRDFNRNRGLMIGSGVLDNIAWLAFGFAVQFVPIVIASTFSEGYIAVAALLGVFLNKERLAYHQKIGICIAVLAGIILARLL